MQTVSIFAWFLQILFEQIWSNVCFIFLIICLCFMFCPDRCLGLVFWRQIVFKEQLEHPGRNVGDDFRHWHPGVAHFQLWHQDSGYAAGTEAAEDPETTEVSGDLKVNQSIDITSSPSALIYYYYLFIWFFYVLSSWLANLLIFLSYCCCLCQIFLSFFGPKVIAIYELLFNKLLVYFMLLYFMQIIYAMSASFLLTFSIIAIFGAFFLR